MVQGKVRLKGWINYLRRVGAQFFISRRQKRDNTRLLVKSLGMVQLQTLFRQVDSLQNLVLIAKKGLVEEPLPSQAYLFHISRSLIQIREQAYHLQYRLNQLSTDDEASQGDIIEPVLSSLYKCEQTISAISYSLESRGVLSVINNDKFLIMVNTLELNATELSSHMRRYNQFCAQKDTLNALFELETLFTDKFSGQSGLSKFHPKFHHPGFKGRYEITESENLARAQEDDSSSELMKKIELIAEPSYAQLAKEILDIYLGLKKCYVVSRKSVINHTLQNISNDIAYFISSVQDIEQSERDALSALHSIYSGLESIRFSTNTESRCSRNLFDKSKQARTKLRQACLECDVGLVFLRQISVKKSFDTKMSNKNS